RHAPEARFPAAADDGLAAVRWVAAHADELGGRPGPLVVAGWSAGGNIAAVTCQLVRDAGGPQIAGQLLLTPVTDSDLTRPSYVENADGYVLTTPLMKWFWDHYAEPAVRSDPRAAPLRAQDLSRLPPACVVTCEFDPLRDEGVAYAEALAAAGVPTRQVAARVLRALTRSSREPLVLPGPAPVAPVDGWFYGAPAMKIGLVGFPGSGKT